MVVPPLAAAHLSASPCTSSSGRLILSAILGWGWGRYAVGAVCCTSRGQVAGAGKGGRGGEEGGLVGCASGAGALGAMTRAS